MEEHSTADSHNLGGQRQAVAPPYISFNTFRTLLDWLKSEGGPLLFDRSFWHAKFSGGTGTQLVAALRFLGLLDGDRPLPDLESMATASVDERRFILAVVLKDSYSVVPFDELDRATPAMLRAWFRAYPIDGHTTRKAISFFINAAKEAELPMSNAIRKMAKNKRQGPSTGALIRDKNSDAGAANAARSSDQRPLTMPAGSQGRSGGRGTVPRSQTSIRLESGGTVTVDLALDLFELSERDRQFVLELIDLTRGYAERIENAPAESGDDITDG